MFGTSSIFVDIISNICIVVQYIYVILNTELNTGYAAYATALNVILCVCNSRCLEHLHRRPFAIAIGEAFAGSHCSLLLP